MRILRVAQKVYPDVKGGGPYHVHAMSRDQAAMGHDVTVLTVGEYGKARREGYQIIRRPATLSALGNDISVGVARYLRRHAGAFDVLHAHSHLYFSTVLAAVGRRLGDTPLAITNHGLYSQNAPEWLFDAYLRTVGRLTFDSADVVFCYTDEDATRVGDLGVESDIEVVANGIDTDRFTPDGPRSDLIGDGSPVVLFVGRLVEGKRPTDAIAAVQRLRERRPGTTLYVCGDGPLRDDLETTVAERGLEDAVTFLGHADYDAMPAIYRSADLLLTTSRAEGLPRTVLEAFATATPVVSSYLEHTAPVVERGGETVPIGDIDGYVDAIERVLGECARLGDAGRASVVERYQWAETVERTTGVLESIQSGRPIGRR